MLYWLPSSWGAHPVGGQQKGTGEAGALACVQGWRCGGERSRHQVAPPAVHAPPHCACEALWGQRGCVGSRRVSRRLGHVFRGGGLVARGAGSHASAHC
eukprot:3038689-Rhodomonas_salina.2